MMNRSYPVLPVPEIIDSNLNHSFKVGYFIIQLNFIVYILAFQNLLKLA